MTFQEIISRLLDEKIKITIFKEDGLIWYDLNTGMKSHLYIADDGEFKYKGRYDKEGEFETFGELLRIVSGCRHGRDFANEDWMNLLVKEELLEKVVETKITYK
jgi:hypothetical protein